MSAAVENFKKGWLLAVFSLATTIISVVVAQNLSDNSKDKSKIYELIDSKASKEELDDAIENIRKENNIQNEWIIKTLDRIDKRTERLEDRIK